MSKRHKRTSTIETTTPQTIAEPCHHGCRLTGAHYPTCDGTLNGKTCQGCRPRPADIGNLCQWCINQLGRDLTDIDTLLDWLDALATTAQDPSAAAPDEIRTRTGDPAETTVLHPAALAADEIRATLTFYIHVTIDERGLTTGPGTITATWLLPHLDWLAATEFAHDLRAEIARAAAIARTFPNPDDIEPGQPLDVPCPRCDQASMWCTPPRQAGQPRRIECTNPDCARIYTEDEWDRLTTPALTGTRA